MLTMGRPGMLTDMADNAGVLQSLRADFANRVGAPTVPAPDLTAVRAELSAHRYIKVMATPPTVTVSAADAATGIAGSTVRAPKLLSGVAVDIDGDLQYQHLNTPVLNYGTSVNAAYVAAPVLTGSAASARYAPSARFGFYGDKFEIVIRTTASSWFYRLRVDGEFVSDHAQYLTGLTVGSVYRILVDFGSVANRDIRMDWAGNQWGGLAMAPAHSVWRVRESAEAPTVFLGDSITAGANAGAAGSTRLDTWHAYAAHLLGWRNYYNIAIAGTGFVNAGTDAAFTARLADIPANARRVVVYGGLNDVTSLAALPAAVDAVFGRVRDQRSDLIVLGVHPFNGNVYANSGYIAVNDILRSKAAQYRGLFIDPLALRPITGTGNATTPNGTGNADVFVNADNTHPTRDGHKFLGRFYADAITDALNG